MTTQIELDDDRLDIIHELILRGLQETSPHEREYGDAYDAFADAAGLPHRIGDQPDRVREVWNDIMEDAAHNPREERDHEMSDGGERSCNRCGAPGPSLYHVKQNDEIVCNNCLGLPGDGKLKLHDHDWQAAGVVEQEYMQPAVLEECQAIGCDAWRQRTLAGVNRVEERDAQ